MELLLEQNGKVLGGDVSELLLDDDDDLDESISSSLDASVAGRSCFCLQAVTDAFQPAS